MEFFFQLSGEHPSLPREEVFAVLAGEGIKFRRVYENQEQRILVLDVASKRIDFLQRLALTRKTGEFIAMGDDLRDLTGRVFDRITGYRSFAIRCRSKKIEEILGAGIKKRGMEVNLDNPGVEVVCLQIEAGKYAVGIDVPLKRDFNQRRPHMRPYFHPTSLHPKMARLAVNLARVKKGDVVLDPFCGTGGILIEAGLMGLEVRGFDIDGRMVDGCRRNLGFYGLSGEIEERDALSLDEGGEVDAIVTDLPYGRGSFLTERNLIEFYGRFMKSAGALLNEGSYMVLIAPDDLSSEISEFEITGRFPWYVHKSLTRRIYVLRRS